MARAPSRPMFGAPALATTTQQSHKSERQCLANLTRRFAQWQVGWPCLQDVCPQVGEVRPRPRRLSAEPQSNRSSPPPPPPPPSSPISTAHARARASRAADGPVPDLPWPIGAPVVTIAPQGACAAPRPVPARATAGCAADEATATTESPAKPSPGVASSSNSPPPGGLSSAELGPPAAPAAPEAAP